MSFNSGLLKYVPLPRKDVLMRALADTSPMSRLSTQLIFPGPDIKKRAFFSLIAPAMSSKFAVKVVGRIEV